MGTSCPTGKQLLALSREECHNNLGPPRPGVGAPAGRGAASEELSPLVEAVGLGCGLWEEMG